jgi:predicted restriction endonuclease
VRLACLWRNGASRSYREVNENLAREHSRDDEDFDVKQIKKTIKEVGVRWNNICAVTGCGIVEVLRASHIKPWRDSTNRERLDPENGLLLAAHVDALFDKGLITFADNGTLRLSKRIDGKERGRLRLPAKLRRRLTKTEAKFLEFHRCHVFD